MHTFSLQPVLGSLESSTAQLGTVLILGNCNLKTSVQTLETFEVSHINSAEFLPFKLVQNVQMFLVDADDRLLD